MGMEYNGNADEDEDSFYIMGGSKLRNFKKTLEADMDLERAQLHRCENQLRRLPFGTLKQGNHGKSLYYKNGEGKCSYIGWKDHLAEQVSRRKFLELRVKAIRNNLKVQEKLLKIYTPYDDFSILEQLPSIYGKGLERANEDERTAFGKTKEQEREISLHYGGQGGHKTLDGKSRDSKSEVIITMMLDAYGIKYSYGEPLYWPSNMPEEAERIKIELGLPSMIVPDFVFTLPSGEKIYWEHTGMLSKKEYAVRWMKKLIFYHWMGITQGVNLIVTADDQNGMLDAEAIAQIIESRLGSLITKPRKH